MTNVHDFTLTAIDGKSTPLADLDGKVLLLVNVASKCGLTPQYEGLEALYRKYADRGLVVLGIPCNQFGKQEPGTEAEIATFCQTKYDVTFPMFAKLEVNGPGRAPLYAWLATQPTTPDGPGDIGWNFAKFLAGRDGSLIGRYSPKLAPDAQELVAAIETALG